MSLRASAVIAGPPCQDYSTATFGGAPSAYSPARWSATYVTAAVYAPVGSSSAEGSGGTSYSQQIGNGGAHSAAAGVLEAEEQEHERTRVLQGDSSSYSSSYSSSSSSS